MTKQHAIFTLFTMFLASQSTFMFGSQAYVTVTTAQEPSSKRVKLFSLDKQVEALEEESKKEAAAKEHSNVLLLTESKVSIYEKLNSFLLCLPPELLQIIAQYACRGYSEIKTGIEKTCLAILPNNRIAYITKPFAHEYKSTYPIAIFDITAGKEDKQLLNNTVPIVALACLSNNTLASGDFRGIIKIWDTTTGTCIKTLAEHTRSITAITNMSDNVFVSASYDKQIKLWSLDTAICQRTIIFDARGRSTSIPFELLALPNSTLAARNPNDTLMIFNTKNGACLATFTRTTPITAMALLPDNTIILLLNSLSLGDWFNEQFIEQINVTKKDVPDKRKIESSSTIYSLALLTNNTVACAREDGKILIYDAKKRKRLETFQAHPQTITALTVFQEKIFSGSTDGTIRVWL